MRWNRWVSNFSSLLQWLAPEGAKKSLGRHTVPPSAAPSSRYLTIYSQLPEHYPNPNTLFWPACDSCWESKTWSNRLTVSSSLSAWRQKQKSFKWSTSGETTARWVSPSHVFINSGCVTFRSSGALNCEWIQEGGTCYSWSNKIVIIGCYISLQWQ